MTYSDIVIKNKNNIQIKIIKSINDKDLSISFSFYTNLHHDFGICQEFMRHKFTTKKSEANKTIQLFQKLIGRKFKLTATDNSLGYTRLIYSL